MPPIPKRQAEAEARARASAEAMAEAMAKAEASAARRAEERRLAPSAIRADLVMLDLGWPVNTEQIKGAYRKACLRYHPDRGGSVEAMQEVNRAHERCLGVVTRVDHRDHDHTNTYQWWGWTAPKPPQPEPPEPCEYEPAQTPAEAMERVNDLSRASFVNLRYWPPSRSNPSNVTRLWLGARMTLYYRQGRYGWVIGVEPPVFSVRLFRSRAEAVGDLANVLML